MEFEIIVQSLDDEHLDLLNTIKGFKKFKRQEGDLSVFETNDGQELLIKVKERVNGLDEQFFIVTISGDKNVLMRYRGEFIADLETKVRREFEFNILRDDVSLELCSELYPIVYRLENKFRRFVTEFMLTRVGRQWWKIHTEGTSLEGNAAREALQPWNNKKLDLKIFNIDFVQLVHFLEFHPAPKKLKTHELIAEIKNKMGDFEAIRELINEQESNWTKYFGEIFYPEFTNDWRKMYKYRNCVAHNRIVDSRILSEAKELAHTLEQTLDNALLKVDAYAPSTADHEVVVDFLYQSAVNSLSDRGASYTDVLEWINDKRSSGVNRFTTDQVVEAVTSTTYTVRDEINMAVARILSTKQDELGIEKAGRELKIFDGRSTTITVWSIA